MTPEGPKLSGGLLTQRDPMPVQSNERSLIHPQLLLVLDACTAPFRVISTIRTPEAQEVAYKTGHSRAHWGESPHDFVPSLAVDLIPLPFIDWKDLTQFHRLAEAMQFAATKVGVDITWGGCGTKGWENVHDYPHFQLTNWKQMHNGKMSPTLV